MIMQPLAPLLTCLKSQCEIVWLVTLLSSLPRWLLICVALIIKLHGQYTASAYLRLLFRIFNLFQPA